MEITDFKWNGFGFPVIFARLPGVKLKNQLVPDVDFNKFSKPLIKHICARQELPLSGAQMRFIRHFFGMSLRQFANFLNVKHPSVVRWESTKQSAARIDINTEIVIRIKILKRLNANRSLIIQVIDRVDRIKELKKLGAYRRLPALRVTEAEVSK